MSTEKGYSICTFEKIHNDTGRGSLQTRFEHNTRKYTPGNVDPELTHLNRELVSLPEGSTYASVFRDTIEQAIYKGDMKKVRSNAVKGVELLLTYTGGINDIDVNKWADDSLAWVKERFGADNVKHAVLHMDEETPHIHIFLVPINDKGKLSWKSFVDGPKACTELVEEYHKEVGKKFGLSRGVKYSAINKKTISKFKKDTIGRALISKEELQPKKDEIDEDSGLILPSYVTRMEDVVQAARFQALDDRNKLQQEYNERQSELIQQQIEYRRLLEEQVEKEEELKKEKEDQEKAYKAKLEALNFLTKDIETRIMSGQMSIEELSKLIKTFDAANRGLANYPDKEYAKNIADGLDAISRWQHKVDKKAEKELKSQIGII